MGYTLNGIRTLYVQEEISVAPSQVVTRIYYADLDAFEFVFNTTGTAVSEAQVSLWGQKCQRAVGNSTPAGLAGVAGRRGNRSHRSHRCDGNNGGPRV
ncbi:hypothetical protein ACFTAO_25965 [Paenibacillus rhizoplanae]